MYKYSFSLYHFLVLCVLFNGIFHTSLHASDRYDVSNDLKMVKPRKPLPAEYITFLPLIVDTFVDANSLEETNATTISQEAQDFFLHENPWLTVVDKLMAKELFRFNYWQEFKQCASHRKQDSLVERKRSDTL